MADAGHTWQQGLPYITRELARDQAAKCGPEWRNRIHAGEPRLGFQRRTALQQWAAGVQTSTDIQTARRRDDLRRALVEVLETGWLRAYSHNQALRDLVAPSLGKLVPAYVPWRDLVCDSLIERAATEELWQRDVADAMPALALGSYLFPEIGEQCRRRLKQFVDAAITFPTWGDMAGYADMDLAAAHLVRGIAIALDWHSDLWNAAETKAIHAVLRQKAGALLLGAYGKAFWARGYTDNHCLNALAALGIAGVAFLGEISEAEEWVGAALVGYDFVGHYAHSDGSWVEGVPYWSYGMSFLCQFAELTDRVCGSARIYDSPFLKSAAAYRLACSTPGLNGIVPFGDAQLQDYYGPSHILYAVAKRHRDATAQWLGDSIPFPNRSGADVEAWTLLWRDPKVEPAQPASLPLDVHLPQWDVAFTRSGWSNLDYLAAFKSGVLNQSHSHLDAGALVLAVGDEWLIETPGYGLPGPGFWDFEHERWTYYSNSTESHSTLLINGKNQRFDTEARATITGLSSGDERCWISIDMSQAYEGISKCSRQVFHRRGVYLLILDEIGGSNEGELLDVEWLLQPGRTTLVETKADGVTIAGASGCVRVCSLTSAGTFALRQPTKRTDIPSDAIRTLSIRQTDTEVTFAVLLVMSPVGDRGASLPNVEAVLGERVPGGRTVTVTGPGFSDILAPGGYW